MNFGEWENECECIQPRSITKLMHYEPISVVSVVLSKEMFIGYLSLGLRTKELFFVVCSTN
jgi:hypothetical protein